MRAILLLWIACSLVAHKAWAEGPATAPRTELRNDLAFQTSDFLKSTAYRSPDKIASEFIASGAYGPLNQAWDKTRQGKWFIEEQRHIFERAMAALIYDRQDLMAEAVKVFDWGFAQEQSDGRFLCEDNFHSTAFFVEAAAHAAILINASSSPAADKKWSQRARSKLLLSARWMMQPEVETLGRQRDLPYTHRFYLDADALGEVGVLTGDKELIKKSKEYVRAGLEHQRPDGVNPEKGGWDTSYQSVGLLFEIYYYSIVADEALQKEMAPSISKGLAWLQSRVKPDGSIDETGNTRSGFGQEVGRNNKPKTMAYGSAYRAFYAWSVIQQDPALEKIARGLYQADQRIRAKNAATSASSAADAH